MVREGIIWGHLVSKQGIKVDHAKIQIIERLTTSTNIQIDKSLLRHVRFYKKYQIFLEDS